MGGYLVAHSRLLQINLIDAVIEHCVEQTAIIFAPGDISDRPLHLLDKLLDNVRLIDFRVTLNIVDAELTIPRPYCKESLMLFKRVCPPNTSYRILEFGGVSIQLDIAIEEV